ncbi:MAG: shikimate dehydrogenase [Acidimicrobiia bacterium]
MTHAVRGSTTVAGVIGDPIAHSRSPEIHNAAYAALGLDWVFVAFPTPAGSGAAAVDAVRALGIAGLSVTMPHKHDAVGACDELSETATRLGVVNAVVNRDGRLVGDSTDGEGFMRAVADAGVDASDAEVVVLGAGGAARAIVCALGDAGAHVNVVARRAEAAHDAAALAPGGAGRALEELDVALDGCDVLVNATPLGMRGEDVPVADESFAGLRLVFDTVYGSTTTPLIARASKQGVTAVDGIGMLVHQAALAFEMFTGHAAPLDAMRTAASA